MEYIPAKTIISPFKGTDSWFGVNYNMNIYKGCCHGCIYCDSRSDCYHIDNFDKVRAKENALQIIRNNLRSKVKTGVVGMGSMSDPYNPFEKELELTRHTLELINAYGFGTAIYTKSTLVTRDIDILKDIAEHSPVLVNITVTTADDALCEKIEPNVSLTSERFQAAKMLSDAGLKVGLLMMPILPFINDTRENILSIIENAHLCGVKYIYPSFGVTLRMNQREWFYDKLDEKFPGIKEMYIKTYGTQYSCISPKAKELWKIFKAQCDKYGIVYNMTDIIRSYKLGYDCIQLSFL